MTGMPRIKDVTITGPACIQIVWLDGTQSSVDLGGWVSRGNNHLAALADPMVFARAGVGAFGGNITWDGDEGELAIDAYHLSLIAEEQAPFEAEDAALWQSALKISNAEVADLLGISSNVWAHYKSGNEIPTTIARLCRAIQRDPVILYAHLRPKSARAAELRRCSTVTSSG